jgi:hypothetical protein
MLQLRSRDAIVCSNNQKTYKHAHKSNALLWIRRVRPAQQQSKVGFRSSSLALQAHRGDEVAAFLVATDTREAAGGDASELLAARLTAGSCCCC